MSEQTSQTAGAYNTWLVWKKTIARPFVFIVLFVASVLLALLVVLLLIWGWEGLWGWERLASNDLWRSVSFRDVSLSAGALLAICLGAWRSKIAQTQANTAAKQADTAAQQSNTAVRSLQNDMYQKNVEMLGSEWLSVRVGGIQALGRLAQDDPETYHRQVMDLLASFVRHPRTDELLLQRHPENRCRPDILEILAAIGLRNEKQLELDANNNVRRIVLHDANLSGLILYGSNLGGTVLQGANLTGVRFREVNLTGTGFLWADLANANLGNADLTNADLVGADLSNADLQEVKGLTQEQLNDACQDPDGGPPRLPEGLVWDEAAAKERYKARPPVVNRWKSATH